MSCLNGKVALVTGATGGIGKEIAILLHRAGCRLVLTGRDEEKLKSVAQETDSYCLAGDLTSDSFLENLMEQSVREVGNADILINCAGVFKIKSILESSIGDYDQSFALNVRAPFILSQHFARNMKEQKWGRIINIASSSAYNGSGETGIYCSTKHALLGLTRSLFQELKEYNVRAFCFSPGSTQTEMARHDKRQDFSTFLDPEEVARFIVHTISFDSGMIAEEVRMNRMVIR
jgi:3-oxoacyl-[acyl-carrier protein] reductase